MKCSMEFFRELVKNKLSATCDHYNNLGAEVTDNEVKVAPFVMKDNKAPMSEYVENVGIKRWRESKRDILRSWLVCIVLIHNASAKGFAIGAGLKGGLAVFSILARLKSRRNFSSVRKIVGMLSNGEAVVVACKETLRYGLIAEGVKVVAAGANPVQITRGIEKTVKALVAELKLMSKE
ncbi:hypothetical protein IFM89_019082, partial [Coptis chinensis]